MRSLFYLLFGSLLISQQLTNIKTLKQVGSQSEFQRDEKQDDASSLAFELPLELTCVMVDTIYLDSLGNVSYEAGDFADASTSAACEPSTLQVFPISDSIHCNVQSPVRLRILAGDGCSNSDSCFVSLVVLDTLPPILKCPRDTITIAPSNSCSRLMVLDTLVISDNCSVDTFYNDYSSSNNISGIFPVDTTRIKYYGVDLSGNVDSCTFLVIVKDETAPDLVCNGPITVNLTSDPTITLNRDLFILHRSDNCGIASYGVSRMDGGCAPGDTLPDENITICCSDGGTDVMAVATVTDYSGNSITCMVAVTVNDRTHPFIVEGLPDITVSCDYFIDLSDMSEFGKVVYHEDDRDPIIIEDELYDNSGIDGLASDVCNPDGLISIENITDNRVNNQGQIHRRFTIKDGNDSIVDVQIITVRDVDSLTLADINFPSDTSIVGTCSASTEPEFTGVPEIDFDDICTMPGVSHKDLVFNYPNSGCKFIKRTWTVIDMGQYVPNTNKGKWVHDQYITIVNTDAPYFISGCQDQEFYGANGACDVIVKMTAVALDSCTQQNDLYYSYTIDVDSDGHIDYTGTNDSINITLPTGIHLVTWQVEDRCGNLTTCEVSVTARENKAPVPVCMNGLSTNLSNGTAVIWAKDFDRGSFDNCTLEKDLKFSFSSDLNDSSFAFTCDDRGDNQVSVFVTDSEGNQSHCNTHILVTDNLETCPTDLPTVIYHRLGGKIETENGIAVENTNLVLINNAEKMDQMADKDGKFMFDHVPNNQGHLLKAAKSDQCIEGISTLDLVLIQRHIMGQQPLSSPYKILAADVNRSGTVSAADLVSLRKLILGTNTGFGDEDCWIFVDKSYEFPDPKYPWDYAKEMEIDAMDDNKTNADFTAVKLGDVNGSYNGILGQDLESRNNKTIRLTATDQTFEAGDLVSVPLIIRSEVEALAFQMNMQFNADAIEFKNLKSQQLDLPEEFYSITRESENGQIKIAFSDIYPVLLKDQDILFTIEFVAKKNGRLNDLLEMEQSALHAIFYDNELDKRTIDFFIEKKSLQPQIVGAPTPNPFVNSTLMHLLLPEGQLVKLEILDDLGRLVFTESKVLLTGENAILINETMVGSSNGVFVVRLSGKDFMVSRKIIKLK